LEYLNLIKNKQSTGKFYLQSLSITTHETTQKTVEKILDVIKSNPKITQNKLIEVTGLTRRGDSKNHKPSLNYQSLVPSNGRNGKNRG